MVVDAVVQPEDLREELSRRLDASRSRRRRFTERRHGVPPGLSLIHI